MNYKKLIVQITIINVLAWLLIELWLKRYSKTDASIGTGFIIFFQLIGYYLCAATSNLKNFVPDKPWPKDCPKHDWQPHPYATKYQEKCVICGAERGKETDSTKL